MLYISFFNLIEYSTVNQSVFDKLINRLMKFKEINYV